MQLTGWECLAAPTGVKIYSRLRNMPRTNTDQVLQTSHLTDNHLYDILIITDSVMEPDNKNMLENKDQHHKSH